MSDISESSVQQAALDASLAEAAARKSKAELDRRRTELEKQKVLSASDREHIAEGRRKAKLQAEGRLLQVGPGRLLPFQREKLTEVASEFGVECFEQMLDAILANNEEQKKAGHWPGYTATYRPPTAEPQHRGSGTSAPIGAPTTKALEPHPDGTPAQRTAWIDQHGIDAYRAHRRVHGDVNEMQIVPDAHGTTAQQTAFVKKFGTQAYREARSLGRK